MNKGIAARWGLLALVGGLIAGAGLLLPGWGHDGGHDAPSSADDGRFHPENRWSSVYHRDAFTVEQARGLGYVEGSPCEPGMGYHYLKPEEAQAWFEGRAGGLQILLYDDTGFLVGVEYLFTASDLNGAPLLGMVGPMEGHAPGMPPHYDQHIYFAEPRCSAEGEGG